MNNLEQKTADLAQAIQETKEWQEYQRATQVYESDKAAQKLLADLQMAQGKLDILEQGNFEGLEEQKTLYDELLNQVRQNRAINDWFDSRKHMEPLVGELANALSRQINFPFTLPPKKSCGCR